MIFKDSKFSIGPDKIEDVNSYDGYLEFSKEKDPMGFLRATELALPCFFSTLDFFMIGDFDQNVYISKKFASVLEGKGITGIEIKNLK